jgi:DNA-binding Xre family transcriptional regulator
MGGMKVVINRVPVLIAEKGQRERRKITLEKAAGEMEISYSTLRAIANDSIREYPKDVLAKMCAYFGCNVGDILSYEEVAEAA